MIFSSNITGLADALAKLDKRLQTIERNKVTIIGGKNTRVHAQGSQFVISSKGKGGGGTVVQSTKCPFDAILKKQEESESEQEDEYHESTFDVSVRMGTVNQLLPSYWDDVGSMTATEVKFLVVNIQTDGTEVTSANLTLEDSADSCIPVSSGSPTGQFLVVIGALIGDSEKVKATPVWNRLIGCGSLQALAKEVYDDNYTWEISTI